MIEARNVSSACSLSLGVSSSCRRICDRSTPLESISGIGKGSWHSLERWLTKQSVAWRSVGELRDEHRILSPEIVEQQRGHAHLLETALSPEFWITGVETVRYVNGRWRAREQTSEGLPQLAASLRKPGKSSGSVLGRLEVQPHLCLELAPLVAFGCDVSKRRSAVEIQVGRPEQRVVEDVRGIKPYLHTLGF